jgi:hypothetical protein
MDGNGVLLAMKYMILRISVIADLDHRQILFMSGVRMMCVRMM